MNIYNLNAEYQKALDNLVVDEDTGELLGIDEVSAIQDDINIKLLNYGKYIKSLQAEHQAYKDEKARVDKEMQRRNKKIEALKEVISQHLPKGQKLEDPQCRLSYRTSKKVTIDDEELLSDEFIEYVPRINRVAIKQQLAVSEVSGAFLQETKHLQIN